MDLCALTRSASQVEAQPGTSDTPLVPVDGWSIEASRTLVFDDLGELSSAAVHPDGSRAFALLHADTLDLGRVTARYWPEWLGVLSVLMCLACLWWGSRTIRRRRLLGELYCGKCNYHLAGLSGSGDGTSKCPECGVDLRRSRPVRGKRLAARLSFPIALCIIALAGYGAPWALGLRRDAIQFRLPISSRAALRWLESQRASWHREFVGQCDLVVELSLPEGVRGRVVCERAGYTYWPLALSPDGTAMYMATRSGNGVDLVSTQTGQRLAWHETAMAQLGFPIPGPLVLGHSADGHGVFLNYWDHEGTEALCVEWNTRTSKSRVAARTATYVRSFQGRQFSTGRMFCLTGPPDSPTYLSTPTFLESYDAKSHVLRAYDSAGAPVSEASSSNLLNYSAEFVASRQRGLVFATTHHRHQPAVVCIDARTCREVSQIPLPRLSWPTLALSPDEQLLVIPLMTGPGIGDGLVVRDLGRNTWAGAARVPSGLFAPRLSIASDNRTMVGVCQGPKRGAKGYSYSLVVWRLP